MHRVRSFSASLAATRLDLSGHTASRAKEDQVGAIERSPLFFYILPAACSVL